MERKERRHHARELARLAAVGDKTKAKVARELGVRVNQLRQWRLDFEEEERNGVLSQSEMKVRTKSSDDTTPAIFPASLTTT
jgi:transposase-like protein